MEFVGGNNCALCGIGSTAPALRAVAKAGLTQLALAVQESSTTRETEERRRIKISSECVTCI
jgi:hypothetical protein